MGRFDSSTLVVIFLRLQFTLHNLIAPLFPRGRVDRFWEEAVRLAHANTLNIYYQLDERKYSGLNRQKISLRNSRCEAQYSVLYFEFIDEGRKPINKRCWRNIRKIAENLEKYYIFVRFLLVG